MPVAERDRRKLKPEPLSVDHFREWARNLVLDNSENWEPEDFQLAFAEDLFAGYREIWLVVPEGNGKTTLLSGLALYHADHVPDAMVPIGAASRDQCEVLHNQAAGFVRRTPMLADRFRVYNGYRRIISLRQAGRIQVFAADDRTGDGVIPTLPLLDELHRQRDLRLYRTWRGKLAKRDAQLVAISTAGEPASEFEEIRILHRTSATEVERNGSHIRAEGGGMVLHDWAVPEDADVEDLEVVKAANPLSTIDTKMLKEKRGSPTMSLPHWQRFVCNQATRIETDGITATEWDALRDEKAKLRKGTWAIGGIDVGFSIDTTALVVLGWESEKRRLVGAIKVLEPPKDGTLDEAEIVAGLIELQKRFEPVAWVYDPNTGARQMAQQLEKGEHFHQRGTEFTFVEHDQKNAAMSLAAARLDEAVRSGALVHDGDRTLRRHALNAVRKPLGAELYRYDRPADAKGTSRRRKYPIDALTALLMANSVAVAEHEVEPASEAWVDFG